MRKNKHVVCLRAGEIEARTLSLLSYHTSSYYSKILYMTMRQQRKLQVAEYSCLHISVKNRCIQSKDDPWFECQDNDGTVLVTDHTHITDNTK